MQPTILFGKISKYKRNSEKFGLPTLEIETSTKPNLKKGSYACKVLIGKETIVGAMHYGPRLTEGEKDNKIDIIISNAKNSHEGDTLVIEVFDYLRETAYFDSINSLIENVTKDFEKANQLLSS